MDNHEEEKEPLIAQSRAEGANLTDVLAAVAELSDHQIPGYAYGDNEAACDMSARLRKIRDLCLEAANEVIQGPRSGPAVMEW